MTGRTVNVGILDTFRSWQPDVDEQVINAAALQQFLAPILDFFFIFFFNY